MRPLSRNYILSKYQKMSEPISRPTFLTILCFFTFMSSVSGLWSQSERLWSPEVGADQTLEVFNMLHEKLKESKTEVDKKTIDILNSASKQVSAKTTSMGAIIMLIFESISLFAAYLMWNLDKRGYYLFLGGVAVAFIAPLLLIGGWFGIITSMSSVFLSFFMAIFYAFQLKYMK